MPWPQEGEDVHCDVCNRKAFWVGKSSNNYVVLDGPPNELDVLLVCKECEALMDHFGFSNYALKRYLEFERKIKGTA